MDFDKIIFALKGVYSNDLNRKSLSDLVTFSTYEFEKHPNTTLPPQIKAFNITMHVDLGIYSKHFSSLKDISEIIRQDFQKISTIWVGSVKIIPDYDKIQLETSEIRPVYTEWEEINSAQVKMIEELKTSSDIFDFQNIGNIARTIFKKLSSLVFISEKHTPTDKSINIGTDKYKNRLIAYIKVELSGESSKDLRHFAEAAITIVDTVIDLTNNVTHKLTSEKDIAEICVASTISAINIIKMTRTQQ